MSILTRGCTQNYKCHGRYLILEFNFPDLQGDVFVLFLTGLKKHPVEDLLKL